MSRGGRRRKKLARGIVKRALNGHGDAGEMPPSALKGWLKAGRNTEQTFEGWEVHAHKPEGDAVEVVIVGRLAYDNLLAHRRDAPEPDAEERAGS